MCLKCNFSPMVASMHGNEALQANPMPQRKWKNNTRMFAWRLFQMVSRILGVHPPELKVSNMFPISTLKRVRFTTPLQYLGCNIFPTPFQYLGSNISPILCDSLCQQVSMPHYEQPAAFPKVNPKSQPGALEWCFPKQTLFCQHATSKTWLLKLTTPFEIKNALRYWALP